MRRRHIRTSNPARWQDGSRDSIGSRYVDEAIMLLNRTTLRECAMHTPTYKSNEIAHWVFRDDHLAKLRAAWPLTTAALAVRNYQLLPDIYLRMNFEDSGILTPSPDWFFPQPERCAALMETERTVGAIVRKYARVKTMLRWFNKHATPGAIRNYWPAVLTLCPNSPAFKDMMDTAPSRYDTPQDIGKMLVLIRDTANTVAAMQLLPEHVEPAKVHDQNVSLVYAADTVHWEGLKIDLDSITVNL